MGNTEVRRQNQCADNDECYHECSVGGHGVFSLLRGFTIVALACSTLGIGVAQLQCVVMTYVESKKLQLAQVTGHGLLRVTVSAVVLTLVRMGGAIAICSVNLGGAGYDLGVL